MKWKYTVPAAYEGVAVSIQARNPMNREDETSKQLEILAVNEGNALIKKTFIATYENVCEEDFSIVPISTAKAMLEQHRPPVSPLEKWKEQLEDKVFLIPAQREREQNRRLNTVPADLQGNVSYAAMPSLHGEKDQRKGFEILAIDESNALVCTTSIDGNVDVVEDDFEIMPLHEAKAMREQFQRKNAQENDNEEDEEETSIRVR